ncbi:hypothetical protein CROQUDRAFT_22679, partial [Cronartium quercuum f. sp. fusiforme G11]
WVLLNAQNWGWMSAKVQGRAQKLKEGYEGPYLVKRVLNEGRNFELELREGNQTFNNFHVSKLKIY